MTELDEETVAESLPVVMLRYTIKALDVDVRGCLSKQDLAHCVHKTKLDDKLSYLRNEVRTVTAQPCGHAGRRLLG